MIIDHTFDSKGIQSLDFQLSPTGTMGGRGDLLRHSNGNLYAVFADTVVSLDNDARDTRHLYFSSSMDGGTTWLPRVELTSGYWDDFPALVELGEESAYPGHIGIVFHRSASYSPTEDTHADEHYIYRASVGLDGALSPGAGIAAVDATLTSTRIIGVTRKSTGHYTIVTYTPDHISFYFWTQADFLAGAWSSASKNNIFTGDTHGARLRKLSNGHFVLLGVTENTVNGTSISAGNVSCDLKAVVSYDDLSTFTSPQTLIAASSAPAFNLTGWSSIGDADLVEMSDGSIQLIFQEFYPYQILSQATNTPLQLPTGSNPIGYFRSVAYSPSRNMLFAGSHIVSGTTDDGVYCIDLSAPSNAVKRLHTASTPALLDKSINSVAISSDERWIAAATEDGVAILDTWVSGAPGDFADWTVHTLRYGTTPGLYAPTLPNKPSIGSVLFIDSVLYFFYATTTNVDHCVGGKLDVSVARGSWAITNLMVHDTATRYLGVENEPVVHDGIIYVFQAGTISSINAATGAAEHFYTIPGTYPYPSIQGIAYDDINNELVVHTSGDGNLTYRLTASLTLIDTIEHSSGTFAWGTTYPGAGEMCYHVASANNTYMRFYSFTDRDYKGIVLNMRDSGHIMSMLAVRVYHSSYLPDKGFALLGGGASIYAYPADNRGRLRRAIYAYNAAAHTLTTAGVDAYDIANEIKIGTKFNQVMFPHLAVTENDVVVVLGQYYAPSEPDRQFGTVLGTIVPSTYTLSAKARIVNSYAPTVSSLARVRNTYTPTIQIRASLIRMVCLKMGAFIVPRGAQSLSLKASIKNTKYSTCSVYFDVDQVRRVACRAQFNTAQDYVVTSGNLLAVKARVARTYYTRCTGHLSVPAVASGILTARFATQASHVQRLTMKAKVRMR